MQRNVYVTNRDFDKIKKATCSGRRRDDSHISAVKVLWLKRRPAAPLYAEISATGFYIEGCLSLIAATATLAEQNALRPDMRIIASAAAFFRARPKGRQRGVITKQLHIENRDRFVFGGMLSTQNAKP